MQDRQWPQAPPRLSVVIAAFNASRFIDRAIKSVQAQPVDDLEILVVDDASSDQTCATVCKLASRDTRIRLIELPRNGGPSAARNAGIKAAKGEWVAILDADDVFKADRMAVIMPLLDRDIFDIVADDLLYFDLDAGLEVGKAGANRTGTVLPVDLDSFLSASLFRPTLKQLGRPFVQYPLLKFVMRRRFLLDHSLRYPEHIRDNEDFVFYFNCFVNGARGAIVPYAGYIYTQRVGSISGRHSNRTRTAVDRSQVVASVSEILERHGLQLSQRQSSLLKRRRAQAIGSETAAKVLTLIRKRHPFAAMALLLRNPSSWFFVAHAMASKARRCLGWGWWLRRSAALQLLDNGVTQPEKPTDPQKRAGQDGCQDP